MFNPGQTQDVSVYVCCLCDGQLEICILSNWIGEKLEPGCFAGHMQLRMNSSVGTLLSTFLFFLGYMCYQGFNKPSFTTNHPLMLLLKENVLELAL